MNECITNMLERRSCKAYTEEQITKEQLEAIVEAGKWAPCGRGAQSPMFVAIQNKELIQRLSKLNAEIMGAQKDPFYGAPTVIVVFADSTYGTYVEDGSLAIGNMLNAAHSLGVGGCWIHRAKQMFETEEGKALMKEWNAPDTYVGVGNCVLGYAKDALPKGKPRKVNYVVYIR